MSIKKEVVLVWSIVCFFLVIISNNIYDNINQKRLRYEADKRSEEYRSKVMRFPVEIKSGEYITIDSGDIFLLGEEDGDKKFQMASKKMFIDEMNTSYSQYVITKDTSYIAINIENEFKFIEHSVPINHISLMNLRNFMEEINDTSINVFPFNDGIYSLIHTNENQYIFNIESGEIIWTRGAYYESPTVDIFEDTLKCGGDLSANTYVFNKYGELIKTIKPQIDYIDFIADIITFALVILMLIIIKKILSSNIKITAIRFLVNIIITLIIIVLICLLLLLAALRLAM